MSATPDSTLANSEQLIADLQRQLAECRAERDEALEYQTATSDVLKVISRSTADVQPVLDTVVETAARLCLADHAGLYREDGGEYRWAASHAQSPEYERIERTVRIRPGSGTLVGRTAEQRRPVSILDAETDPLYEPKEDARKGDIHSLLGVPLLREGEPIGVIGLARTRIEPFSERQIELVRTFADQAVIAIENARLITETREALEQQTAMAEVLQVINSSPGDLAPVFTAMLERATRLCDAAAGVLWIVEAGRFRAVASRGLPAAFEEFLREPVEAGPDTGVGRLARGDQLAHIADMAVASGYRSDDPLHRAAVDLGGIGSLLAVPLQKDGTLLGAFGITRLEVRPFSDKQIALLQNFAAQAVIAMENARLLGELQARTRDLEESLEYQTAISDVLKVISRSTADVQPVLDTVAATAARLCGADSGTIWIREGDVYRAVSSSASAADPELWAALRQRRLGPGRDSVVGRVVLEGRVVHVEDIRAIPDFALPEGVAAGDRTVLGVPLLREGAVLGTIGLVRKRVQPFTDRQIELVRTFADQAVIAMENARLLSELQARTRDLEESLEYQTATSDVLNVISRSTADVQPVLDTVAETAVRLCGADGGSITTREGEVYRYVSAYAADAGFWAALRQRTLVPGRDSTAGRVALEGRVVHIADIRTEPDHARPEAVAAGYHTSLGVPLLREGAVLGTISLARKRVQPYTERQIELVRTFADQAVIAIENARLLGELQSRTRDLEESLEYQTATSDVLNVISRSTADVQPVLDTVVETAARLCGTDLAMIMIREGEVYRFVSGSAVEPEHWAALRQ